MVIAYILDEEGNPILDENGNPIDELEQKNRDVKAKLEPILEEFLVEKKQMLAMKKVPKLGYRFMKQIMLELSHYPPMSAEDFVSLDYETVNRYYIKFSELTAFYNRHFEIVDNKNIFQRYMCINSRQYEALENHEDEQIQGVMRMINGDYIGLAWIAGESGDANPKATTDRLKASGAAGHDVTSAVEDKMIDKMGKSSSPLELENMLNGIFGKNRLGGG